MNTPQGQAVQSVMNQLPIRTLLQLAQAAGVPVPPQLAMTMGGQPPPYMAPPMTPTAAAPTATSYAPTTSTPAAAPAQAAITDVTGSRPADSQPPGRAPDYFQRHGGQVGANLTRVNTPFGPVTANQQVAQDISGLTNEMKEKGVPGIKSFGSYNPRQKAYGSGWSSHAFGAAFDINDSAGPMNAQTQAWINQHPQEWQDMLARHNFTQYMPTKDPNHLEWTGPSQTAGGPPRAEDLSQLGDPSQGRGKVNVGRDQIINPSATQYRDISRAGNRADWPKFESETQPSTMVEDERDTGDSSFANRFPAWANDPNIADRLVREGQASGAGAYIPPEDQPLVAELLRQRQLLRRTGPTVR